MRQLLGAKAGAWSNIFTLLWPDVALPQRLIQATTAEKANPDAATAVVPTEGDKPDADQPDVGRLFREARKLYSADIRLFLAILVWDVIGSPRAAREAPCRFNRFNKRKKHAVDAEGLSFLQQFLNKVGIALCERLTLFLPEAFQLGDPLEPPDVGFSWQLDEVRVPLTRLGHLDLTKVLQMEGRDDPKLQALDGTWNAVYRGEYKSPSGLMLSTPGIASAPLGDWVAFMLSHGASPKVGHGRALGLTFRLLEQVGEQLEDHQRLMLEPCSPSDVPRLTGYQKKRHANTNEAEALLSEEMGGSSDDISCRIYCLASLRDNWASLQRTERKSLIIANDAGEVVDQNIELFYAFSPTLGHGLMFPHQVRPPSTPIC